MDPITKVLLVGVGHQFSNESGVCQDLTHLVEQYRPQIVGVEVPLSEYFLAFARKHSAPLLEKASRQGSTCAKTLSETELHNRLGIEHFANGNYVEAVLCFHRVLTADANHTDAVENLGLAYRSCRGSELEHVIFPLQLKLGYRIVAVGGTQISHFQAREAARRELDSDPELRQRWQTYSVFCGVIWQRALPRYQTLAGMNSEVSHALHEVAHEAATVLLGSDALDLCWSEQNRMAWQNIRRLIASNPGARILVVYGCEHLYALLAEARKMEETELLRLSDFMSDGSWSYRATLH